MLYHPKRRPRHETVRLRGLDIRLTHWGPSPPPGIAPVVLLHGWLDTADTFQFVVDALEHDRGCTALDWRGFGSSAWPAEGYWFPDYLADLDALLDHVSPQVPVPLVGHSMGGNVASLYAGLRPARVRCVVDLEGFGLPRTTPGEAPQRLDRWLNEVKADPVLKDYDSFEQLALVIRHRYPRVNAERAEFIAHAWARQADDGRIRLLGDARHKRVNPILYKREDAQACWRQIVAPFLMVLGEDSSYLRALGPDGTAESIRSVIAHAQIARIPDAGHLLHIESPQAVAPLIDEFLVRYAD